MNSLRFGVDQAVVCNYDNLWAAGRIVKLHYEIRAEDAGDSPAGTVVPYQIELSEGRRIYALLDDDCTIRKVSCSPTTLADELGWEQVFVFDDFEAHCSAASEKPRTYYSQKEVDQHGFVWRIQYSLCKNPEEAGGLQLGIFLAVCSSDYDSMPLCWNLHARIRLSVLDVCVVDACPYYTRLLPAHGTKNVSSARDEECFLRTGRGTVDVSNLRMNSGELHVHVCVDAISYSAEEIDMQRVSSEDLLRYSDIYSDRRPVYELGICASNCFMYFNTKIRCWMTVKAVGDDSCYALSRSTARTPDLAPEGSWEVAKDGHWYPQPDVAASLAMSSSSATRQTIAFYGAALRCSAGEYHVESGYAAISVEWLTTFKKLSEAHLANVDLFHAAELCLLGLVQRRLKDGSDPNMRDPVSSKTPLLVCVDRVSTTPAVLSICEELLEHGALSTTVDSFDCPALHIASYHGHADLCRLLLEHGAMQQLEYTAQISEGSLIMTALQIACYYAAHDGHLRVVDLLCRSGADVKVTSDGVSPLHDLMAVAFHENRQSGALSTTRSQLSAASFFDAASSMQINYFAPLRGPEHLKVRTRLYKARLEKMKKESTKAGALFESLAARAASADESERAMAQLLLDDEADKRMEKTEAKKRKDVEQQAKARQAAAVKQRGQEEVGQQKKEVGLTLQRNGTTATTSRVGSEREQTEYTCQRYSCKDAGVGASPNAADMQCFQNLDDFTSRLKRRLQQGNELAYEQTLASWENVTPRARFEGAPEGISEEVPSVGVYRFLKVTEIMSKTVELISKQATKQRCNKKTVPAYFPGFLFHCTDKTAADILEKGVVGSAAGRDWQQLSDNVTDTTLLFLYNVDSKNLIGTFHAKSRPEENRDLKSKFPYRVQLDHSTDHSSALRIRKCKGRFRYSKGKLDAVQTRELVQLLQTARARTCGRTCRSRRTNQEEIIRCREFRSRRFECKAKATDVHEAARDVTGKHSQYHHVKLAQDIFQKW
jgi:hypothetical protein